VVEKAFGIQGLGEETVRAVQRHDIVWLMTLAIAAALAGSLVSLLSELAVAAIDPRLRAMIFRRRRAFE
jgi:ABC-type dipeptide/oligopeptide/nickel transport system permease component